MALRAASFVSVSRRSAALPPATTVDAISALSRASSASADVTRTGMPPWPSIWAYWPAPRRDLVPHPRGLGVPAALDRLHHDPALARLADVTPVVESVLVVHVRRRVPHEHDHAQRIAGRPGEPMDGVVHGRGHVLGAVAAAFRPELGEMANTSSMSPVKS